MQLYNYLHHLPEEAFWATVGFGMAQFYQRFSQPGSCGFWEVCWIFYCFWDTSPRKVFIRMLRHTSKAHAKYETETKIVLVAADLTFYGITQLPLFSFVNPFLYRLVPSKRTCPIMSVHTVSKIVLLCGLHNLCSHIMARSDLFISLFVHESRAPVTWSSIVVLYGALIWVSHLDCKRGLELFFSGDRITS